MLRIDVVPIRDHAFFEQPVLEQDVGQRLLEGAHLSAQLLDLAGRRLAFGVTRQPLLAGFQELLRPFVIEALRDPLAPTQLRDRVLAAQAFQDDADPLFRAVLLACYAADLADMGFGRGLRPGFRSRLRSFRATMISKSSVPDSPQGVLRMLTGNRPLALGRGPRLCR
jgi:hypothetical protein